MVSYLRFLGVKNFMEAIDISKKDRIDIKELVLPERLVVSDKSVIGYSMPYIDGIDLSILLNSENIDIKEKIKYLKQIGTILRKMVTAR